MNKNIVNSEYLEFVEQLKIRVSESRYQAARTVNSELIKLYHHIGNEILKRQEIYGWGAKVIDNLSRDLHSAFPEMKGFSRWNMIMEIYGKSKYLLILILLTLITGDAIAIDDHPTDPFGSMMCDVVKYYIIGGLKLLQ